MRLLVIFFFNHKYYNNEPQSFHHLRNIKLWHISNNEAYHEQHQHKLLTYILSGVHETFSDWEGLN